MLITFLILAVYGLLFLFGMGDLASPEAIVQVTAGFLLSWGLTNYFKNLTGVYRFGALLLHLIICGLIALLGIVISSYYKNEPVVLADLVNKIPQIFMLATLAYKGSAWWNAPSVENNLNES